MPNTKNLIERKLRNKGYAIGLEASYPNKVDGHYVSSVWPFIILVLFGLVYAFAYANDLALPKIVSRDEVRDNPELFCGECSKSIIRKFTNFGPRVFGNVVNEYDTPKMIEDIIRDIKANASMNQSILIQRQKGNGSYFLEYNPPFTNIYSDVQNVIVKIEGSDGEHSILVNCHYDTVPFSPGGTDNAISCATMLEIIRTLSISNTRLKHNLVFLFNGAEEVSLLGSHLFLSHEWAGECRTFVNLEGAGAGGRHVLFQSGPKHPWLFKYFAKSVPHLHGQSLGEELFQNGVLPSDTDFRIFRDFKNIPGMDLAFWESGYTYHTSYDSDTIISDGSIQMIGDNVLALVQILGNAEEVNDLKSHSQGEMVYYDYLGWFMISYSATSNIILNTLVILLGIASIMIFIGRPSRWLHIKQFIHTVSYRLLSMICATAITITVGTLIDLLAPLAMPWYSRSWLIFPLYWCPFLATYLYCTHRWMDKPSSLSVSTITQMDLVAQQVPWLFILFVTTAGGYRSSALLFPTVLSNVLANLIVHLTHLKRTVFKWIWIYILIQMPALLYNSYLVVLLYKFFMPIFGRAGPVNGDMVISILSCIVILLLLNFLLPLMRLVHDPKKIMLVLMAFFACAVLLLPYIGHPYSVTLDDPRPQRYVIIHTHRQFNDKYQIIRSDNGYVVYNMDRNSPYTIPNVQDSIESVDELCEAELFCGIPLSESRMIPKCRKSSWIPADPPFLYTDTEIVKTEQPSCDKTTMMCNVSIVLKGPNRLTFAVVPRSEVSLADWSLGQVPKPTITWNDRPVYFGQVSCGSHECALHAVFAFRATADQIRGYPMADFVLSGHYLNEKSSVRTKQFEEFLAAMPEWTSARAWSSVHRTYVF